MPEKAPAGQLPRSVDIVADNDLVDKCKPGDRVQVIGMYRCMPGKKNGYTSGAFRTILIANNIRQLNKDESPTFTGDDIAKIRKFSKTNKVRARDVMRKFLVWRNDSSFCVFSFRTCLRFWLGRSHLPFTVTSLLRRLCCACCSEEQRKFSKTAQESEGITTKFNLFRSLMEWYVELNVWCF